MPTQHLPVARIAELLSVSRNAVYELIDRGELQATRVGRRLVVSEAEYERFVRNGGSAAA